MAYIAADLSRWDIGYESIIVGPGKICSRCDYVADEGEPIWYKGWMDTSSRGPIDATIVYLCPRCRGELHAWRNAHPKRHQISGLELDRRMRTRWQQHGHIVRHKGHQPKPTPKKEPKYKQETLL